MENLVGRIALIERRLQLLCEEISLVQSQPPGSESAAAAHSANGEAIGHLASAQDGAAAAAFPGEAHLDADALSVFAHGFYPREYDAEGEMFRWTGHGPLCELRFFIDRSTDRQFRMKVGDTSQDILSRICGFIDYAAIPIGIVDEDNTSYLVGTVPKRASTRLAVVSFLLGEMVPGKKSATANAAPPSWLGFKFYALDVS